MNSRQRLGMLGEESAARFLAGQGMRILERGFRSPFGELDLVAQDGDSIVFVEVKARKSSRFGHPQEAVTWTKRSHMIKAALAYLKARRVTDRPIRFDVVAIEAGKLDHIRDAFQAGGFTR
jgi:putative endonuclease